MMKKTYLLVSPTIYLGLVAGALLGSMAREFVHAVLIATIQSTLSGVTAAGSTQSALLWMKVYWPVLGLLILLANTLLISLSIFLGVLWRPSLLPLWGFFTFNLFLVSAIYSALSLEAFLLLLPVLLPEAQAVILGFTAALHLARQPGDYRRRLSAWRCTLPPLRWIPALLFLAGMWEAWVIAGFI